MHPELLKIPYLNLTVQSYGLMLVIGFLAAITIIRLLSKDITPDPQLITNAALYSLIAGIAGARVFYVLHYFGKFKDNLLDIFKIWQGGLELLGGVLLAITVIALYLRYHKLPARKYLDILAIGLMVALGFGRIGCICKGCCFGKPTNVPWAVSFPYGSDAYSSQTRPDLKRDRPNPYIALPNDFFGYYEKDKLQFYGLKPFESLTPQQQQQVLPHGQYCILPIHPTQAYESFGAFLIATVLYLLWRRTKKSDMPVSNHHFLRNPGCIFGLMFIFYSIMRFTIEFFRDDNPFEYGHLTISQIIGIILFFFGILLTVLWNAIPDTTPPEKSPNNGKNTR